jgi:AcrR family transcriptional regulator
MHEREQAGNRTRKDQMSGKSPELPQEPDPRVERTYDALGSALIALMHEKPFDSITVQEVLDRAHVGRSTFYTHFSDKNDLFFSNADRFFEHVATVLSQRGENSNRVAPVREMFQHVAEVGEFRAATVRAGKMHDMMDLLKGHLARGIEQRFNELPAGQAIAPESRPAFAYALAGAFISLMEWWIDRGTPVSAAHMDDVFHKMVWSGVTEFSPEPPSKATT